MLWPVVVDCLRNLLKELLAAERESQGQGHISDQTQAHIQARAHDRAKDRHAALRECYRAALQQAGADDPARLLESLSRTLAEAQLVTATPNACVGADGSNGASPL